MLASDKLALSVLARFTGWPGESASWPVQVSFRLPLSLFAFCCRSFSSSFVTEVTSSTLKPPRFALKCHEIIVADKVLVHGMISLKDHPFTGVL